MFAFPTPIGARSGSAKRLQHALMRFGRVGIIGQFRLVPVRFRQHLQKLLERREIVAVHGGFDDRFHPVIPRNEGGIDGSHRGLPCGRIRRLLGDPLPPALRPAVIGGRLGEQLPHALITSRIARSGNSSCKRRTAATAGSSSLPAPKISSNSPAYSCRQWLRKASYIPSSKPLTGFRIETAGANSGRRAYPRA